MPVPGRGMFCMDGPTVVRLPHDLAERLDRVAEAELRSRNNAAQVLILESLARCEAQDAQEESQ